MDPDIPNILSKSFFEHYTDKPDFVGQLHNRDFVMCQEAGEVINEKGCPDIGRGKTYQRLRLFLGNSWTELLFWDPLLTMSLN